MKNKEIPILIDQSQLPKNPLPGKDGFLPALVHGNSVYSGLKLKEMIRNHAVGLLWGRGYTLHGKDREKIQEVINLSGGIHFLMALENCLFDYGHALVNIHRTIGDGIRLTVPILFGTSQTAKVWDEEELAITQERITHDDSNLILRRESTRYKTTISLHMDKGDGTPEEGISFSEESEEEY